MSRNTGNSLIINSIATLFCIVLFASCSKDEDVSGIPKADLLCGESWYIKAFSIDPSYPVVIGGLTFKVNDLYFLFKNCATDNSLIFNTDSTLVQDTGSKKCDPDEEQTVYGTWQLDAAEKNITWQITGEAEQEYEIVELNHDVLKVKDFFTENNVTYSAILTLKH